MAVLVTYRRDVGQRDGAHDLGARIHDSQCTCEHPTLRDLPLGYLHAFKRLVEHLLEIAHDRGRLRRFGRRALLECAGAWELLGTLGGGC